MTPCCPWFAPVTLPVELVCSNRSPFGLSENEETSKQFPQRNSEKIHSLISDHVARAQLLGRSQLKKWVQNFWNHLDTRGASVPTWLVITYLHRKNVSTESTLVSVGYCVLLMCSPECRHQTAWQITSDQPAFIRSESANQIEVACLFWSHCWIFSINTGHNWCWCLALIKSVIINEKINQSSPVLFHQ